MKIVILYYKRFWYPIEVCETMWLIALDLTPATLVSYPSQIHSCICIDACAGACLLHVCDSFILFQVGNLVLKTLRNPQGLYEEMVKWLTVMIHEDTDICVEHSWAVICSTYVSSFFQLQGSFLGVLLKVHLRCGLINSPL